MMADNDLAYRENIDDIRQRLIAAFGEPVWRTPLPPVDELVSTILSQNTNDINRDAAFESLKAAFPDWDSVMNADTDKVVDAIRIAGLANQKGPRIQKALREIADHTGGEITLDFLREMPLEEARVWLTGMKGVGPKTAAIVLLFAMGIPAFPGGYAYLPGEWAAGHPTGEPVGGEDPHLSRRTNPRRLFL